MTRQEAMRQLEAMGTAQNRTVYPRHGVKGPLFGVSYAKLGALKKKIGTDQKLAEELWATGNHDARVLACMVADPAQMKPGLIDAWAKELDNYVLTDALASLVAKSPHARKKMEKWCKSTGEWTGAAGYNVLCHLAMQDESLSDQDLSARLRAIESGIHESKNRARHSMNMALIAIGIRNASLQKKAVAAAKRIGKVEVDHGETGCKTPDAIPYIERAVARKKGRK